MLLAINEGDAEVRHVLRNEFAEAMVLLRRDLANFSTSISADVKGVEQKVQTGNLADVTEFATIRSKQIEQAGDITDLKDDVEANGKAIAELQAGALASKEVSALKRWAIGAALFPSVSIILTALGIYIASQ